ncbi:hypothetical protein L1049_003274 [Liquidambar formosana]|uniref:Uncharacterized protein n=1 Tax=Liquidambar formosana TaxID=63359 RepID=A0AAP0R803_LIQFO
MSYDLFRWYKDEVTKTNPSSMVEIEYDSTFGRWVSRILFAPSEGQFERYIAGTPSSYKERMVKLLSECAYAPSTTSFNYKITQLLQKDRDKDYPNDGDVILPSSSKTQPGRPKKKRIPSKGEKTTQIRCGRYNKLGNHNKKTCKEHL